MATQLYDEVEKFAKSNRYQGVTLNTFNRFKTNISLIIKRGYEIYDLDKSGNYSNDPKIKFKLKF